MLARDYQDIIAGAIFALIGASVAIWSWANYPLGSITHMGPGAFPAGLGVLLMFIGVLVMLPAFFRAGPSIPMPDFRAFVFVALALTLFSFTIRWLGLVPAIILVVMTSVLADSKLGIIGSTILAVGLSIAGWLIFSVALGIPLQAFGQVWQTWMFWQ
ncbi:MAG: tripartite tricarboxylate transporter TctB family protein [Pseudolabrys sp.]|nr:tripartite tricarboxylate transporter TctB family protein [Pseudolabrys sp.]